MCSAERSSRIDYSLSLSGTFWRKTYDVVSVWYFRMFPSCVPNQIQISFWHMCTNCRLIVVYNIYIYMHSAHHTLLVRWMCLATSLHSIAEEARVHVSPLVFGTIRKLHHSLVSMKCVHACGTCQRHSATKPDRQTLGGAQSSPKKSPIISQFILLLCRYNSIFTQLLCINCGKISGWYAVNLIFV